MLKIGRQKLSKCLQYLASTLKYNYCQCAETRVVELPVGKVKGKWQKGLYGYDYYSFEGIPFGRPPVGELRFRPSQPAESWMGKQLNCLREREPPVQVDMETGCVIGNEDCLHLNVYTKHFDTAKPPLPVIVYFYGGAFAIGGALRVNYGPDYFMREDLVFVVFNYRLSTLGFLSLSKPELKVPGNAGLHDQLLALRWIKKFICHFNGDAKNITIMGTSAGAASVHFMMCLPEACGLFHKAIMMSGSMLCPWVQVPNEDTMCCRLALQLGYTGVQTEPEILKYLLSLPPNKLVQHQLLDAPQHCFGHFVPFVPRLENKTSGGLVQRPFLQMMREAWSKQVPLLLGGNSFEGLFMYPYCMNNNGYILDLLKQQPAMVLPYDLYQSFPKEKREALAAELIRFHYGPRSISKDNVTQALDLFSYKLFWHGIHRVVLSRLAFAQAATYLYRFDFDSPTANLVRLQLCGNDIKRGVCHADELGYMFPREGVRKQPLNAAENWTIHRMVGIVTTFSRTGDPNCVETDEEVWTPVEQKDPFKAMNIGLKLEVKTQLEKEGLKVWNQLYNNDSCLLYGK